MNSRKESSTKNRSASPSRNHHSENEERTKQLPTLNENNGKTDDSKNESVFRKPTPINNGNNHSNNNKLKSVEISTATKRTSTVFGNNMIIILNQIFIHIYITLFMS